MADGDERSVAELKRTAERSRAEFTQTVGQLRSKVSETVTDFRDRVSPNAIKAEVGDYFRTRGDILLDKARANPLQTAAIGAGLAYPLLGIARSIPAPILMIGAGLFLLGSSPGQKLTRKVGAVASHVSHRISEQADAVTGNIHDARDIASARLDEMAKSASAVLNSAREQTSDAAAALSDGAARWGEKAAGFAGAISEGMSDLKQKADATVETASGAIHDSATSASSGVQIAVKAAADFGNDAAHKVSRGATETTKQVSTLVSETIQQNPLLVGGIGLAVGMLLASALPRSDVEAGIMGAASARIKKRAGVAASEGIEAAKSVASTVLGDVADRADQEGLSPQAIHQAAEDLGRRVRKVAENATTAAFELSANKGTDAA